MLKNRKVWLMLLLSLFFLLGLIIYIPAWSVGSLIAHYTQNRVRTLNEQGSFWHGSAMLAAFNSNQKALIPLMVIGWDIKLGITKLVTIKFNVSKQPIAEVSLSKAGLQISNLNLAMSLDQLSAFLGNLNTLGLSGNAQVSSSGIKLTSGKAQGIVSLHLQDVGSSLAPLNPVGSYNVNLDLNSSSISVNSDAGAILDVSGNGDFNSLNLITKVTPDKKDQFFQFMTMMGVPQADGSYQLKVF